MEKEKYISTADLSRILGISRQGIQKMLKGRTEVKVRQIGGGFLYEVETLPKDILKRMQSARNEAVHQLQTLQPKSTKDLSFEKEPIKSNLQSSSMKAS